MAIQDILAQSATTTVPSSVRQLEEVAKLIDTTKCIGCKACQVAC
ncbi:4Fe-4S binding protein, partial [Pseudomonas sp.]